MTVRPYTSVYWNVDVLHIGSTPIYLAPTLLLLKSLTACTLLYSTPTLLPLLEIQLLYLTSTGCPSTLTPLICNPYRTGVLKRSQSCSPTLAVARETIFEQRDTIAASSKTRANVQGEQRVHRLYVQACMPRGESSPRSWEGLRSFLRARWSDDRGYGCVCVCVCDGLCMWWRCNYI